MTLDAALAAALAALPPPGVLVGHRWIGAADAAALLPGELPEEAGPRQRRQSGAARIVARTLLARLGVAPAPLPRGPTRAPCWPPGTVGSLAHDSAVAVAAVARSADWAGIGIDVEPDADLPPELACIVATPAELAVLPQPLRAGRLAFAVKEATFKALHPLTGRFLEFDDVTIDWPARRARTRHGETVAIFFATSPRIVALACLEGVASR